MNISLNTNDPLQFVLLILILGVLTWAIYLVLRELIADGYLLAKKKERYEEERKKGRNS